MLRERGLAVWPSFKAKAWGEVDLARLYAIADCKAAERAQTGES